MTLPKRRSQTRCARTAQQTFGMNSRGRAQTVFFLALFVATVLFLNNVTHLADVPFGALPSSQGDFLFSRSTSTQNSPPGAPASSPAAPVEKDSEQPKAPEPPAGGEDNLQAGAGAGAGGGGDDDPNAQQQANPQVDESGVVGDNADTPAAGTSAENTDTDPDTDPTEPDENTPSEGENSNNDNNGGPDISKMSRAEQYALFNAEVGILSDTPFESFIEKHKEIDEFDNTQRCRRYGYSFSASQERNRRIFYGAVMQDEPWELFEILSAESYGLFEAMVFMEPDRDFYGEPREPLRLEATALLQSMFGVDKVRVIRYSNDDESVKGDLLHDMAREEIVKAWKDMGMMVDDVGYMSNIDDIFARDFIKAIQHCELPEMKYDLHHCLHNRVKVFGNCQVYETSPDCVSRTKKYEHPDMMIGACIQGIGDESFNRLAPRDETGIYREKGWNCEDREQEKDIKDQKYPLWTGADMRQLCGGRQANLRASMHQQYTAFHFRNFYNTAKDMRLKYTTEEELYDKSLDDLGEDMRVTYRCIKEIDDEKNAVTKREPGGFKVLKPMTPIYFGDEKYRAAVHERAKKKILDDEKNVKADTKKESTKKEDAKKDDTKKETKKEATKKDTKKDAKKDLKKETEQKKTTKKK